MKVKISCPKCRSANVSIVPNVEDSTPMYKCNQCGYKHNLFPQFGKKSEEEEED